MSQTLRNDAFLYLAFLATGYATVAVGTLEKLACLGFALVCLVIRTFVKESGLGKIAKKK